MIEISKVVTIQRPSCWVAPPLGVFKINSDAALNSHDNVSSFGVVIRDWRGRVLASLCQNVKSCY